MNGCLLLPDGSCYDPASAQDHTGLTFAGNGRNPRRDPKRDPRNFMKDPAWLKCPECGADDRFAILAESHPRGDSMVQIYCSHGDAVWPVVQISQPQMNNSIAKQLGLPQAEAPAIDIELDLSDMGGD